MKFRFLFLFVLFNPSFAFAGNCETELIRDPIPGYQADSNVHPDYFELQKVASTSISRESIEKLFISIELNSLQKVRSPDVSLGSGERRFCDGEVIVGEYYIYPTGAILLEFRKAIHKPKSQKNYKLWGKPFDQLCSLAQNFSGLVAKIEKQKFNNSQKFVILSNLYNMKTCDFVKDEIAIELSRLSSLPLLKTDVFGKPIDEFPTQGCYLDPVHDGFRLVIGGEEKAFATIERDSEGKILLFNPLVPIKDIANLPPHDPCVKFARRIANLPNENPEEAKELAHKMRALRDFDAGPKIDLFESPPSAVKNDSIVRQGTGRVSEDLLVTYGLAPCVGVAVLNASTKKAMLIHVAPASNVKALFASLVPKLGKGELTAVVAGGWAESSSRNALYNVLQNLNQNGIRLIGHRPNSELIDSLAVDPKSGKFY